jgi:hypothetical protein
LANGRRNWRQTLTDWRSRGLAIVDAGSFDHPSYLSIKALEDALEATGLPRVKNSSAIERIWSRAIIRFDLTRFFVRLTRRTNFVVIMNLPARRFYPQGWWSESIVYCFDCWSGRYDEWERFLQRNRIRIAFFAARDAARELSRRLPSHTISWMPEAIDAIAYSPARPLSERSIDLLEFGRSWPCYHERIMPHCKASGLGHMFPTDGKLVFPTQEGSIRAWPMPSWWFAFRNRSVTPKSPDRPRRCRCGFSKSSPAERFRWAAVPGKCAICSGTIR